MAIVPLLSAAVQYRVNRYLGVPSKQNAAAVAAIIKRGGMIAQKIVQIVASRPDVITDVDLLLELRELQSRQIMTDVHQASIATVTIDREDDVAVKRLNDPAMLSDSKLIGVALWLMQPLARHPQLAVCVDMLETLSNELDFESELSKNCAIRGALSKSSVVVIPKTLRSSKTEVVMEIIDSVLVKDIGSDYVRLDLVHQFFKDMTMAAVRTGVVHLDLHAGNVGITPDDRIVVYDMGSIRTVDIAVTRRSFSAMFQASEMLFFEDWPALAKHLVSSRIVIEVREVRNLRLLTKVSTKYARGEATSAEIGMCLREIKGDVNLDASLFQLIQSMSILEGCCKVMNPAFNLADAFPPETMLEMFALMEP